MRSSCSYNTLLLLFQFGEEFHLHAISVWFKQNIIRDNYGYNGSSLRCAISVWWRVSLTLPVLIIMMSFSYTSHARLANIFSYNDAPRAGVSQDMRFSYTVFVMVTQKQSQMLCLDQTKMQEQGLTGYSSVRLTSRASHRLGKCRLSWVWLGLGLLSALSWCTACLGRGSHRHASSGFVFATDWPDSSVLTWPRPYICLSFYIDRAV